MNNHNEILFELSLRQAKKLLEMKLINKTEFKKLRLFLVEKYKPIIPSLLDL
ncbi:MULTISPECIES: SHOCT domain-containing protein [Enterococcus]|uniref:SHOCT domain-containing protein n=1 Tax=Enterococcus TaxID=1350 RepID=UPI0035D74FBD